MLFLQAHVVIRSVLYVHHGAVLAISGTHLSGPSALARCLQLDLLIGPDLKLHQ